MLPRSITSLPYLTLPYRKQKPAAAPVCNIFLMSKMTILGFLLSFFSNVFFSYLRPNTTP